MTNSEVLSLILAAVDDVGRVFDYAETATWPPGSLDEFCRLGLIRQAAHGLYAPCPDCADGHIEPVAVRVGPDETKRFYIWCPECLRVEVQAEMCNGWQVYPAGLAAAVAATLGLKGTPKPVVADRFWRLGRTPWPPGSSGTREVVLGRRLHDKDGSSLAAHVGPGGRTMVLVPHHVPDERVWPGAVPAVISLAEIMTWDNGKPVLDIMAMVDVVETADHLGNQAATISLNANGKRTLRRQVKAEMKGQLEDDVLVAAYKMCGSVRKAADTLTDQLGRTITKDKVQRAITRAGGAETLREEMDSASVARRVASQRCDRARKIIERR